MKKALQISIICLISLFFGFYALFLNFPKFIDINSHIKKIEETTKTKIVFDDLKIQPKYNLLTSISFKNLNIKNLENRDLINIDNFSSDLSLLSFKSTKFINLKLDVPNLDLSYLTPYLVEYDENLKDIKGNISCHLYSKDGSITGVLNLKDFSIKNDAYDIKSSEEIIIKPNIYLDKNKIKINSLSVSSKKMNMNLEGEILDYLKKNPKINIKTNLKNTSLERLIYFLPNLIPTPDDSIRKIKKYGADANLNGDISISGDVFLPSIAGKIDIKNIVVLRGKYKIKPSYGFAEFLGDKVKIFVRAFAYNDEYVDIDGVATIEEVPKGEFVIKSTKNVDLELAEAILLPVKDIIGFILGPVPMMDVKGVGSIDLYLKGTKTYGILDGYFEFRDASATLNGLKTYLTNGRGKITFKDYDIFYDGIVAKLKGADVLVGGKADIDGNCFMKINIKDLDNFDFKEILAENSSRKAHNLDLIDKFELKSNAEFTFKTKFKPNFKEINLSKLNIVGDVVFENVENSPLKHRSGKIVLKDNKIKTENLSFDVFKANTKLDFILSEIMNIEFSDTMRNYNENPKIKGNISLQNASLIDFEKEIEKYFSKNNKFAGFADFSGFLNSNISIDNSNINGNIDFKDVNFFDKKNKVKIKLNSGVVKIINNNLILDALNLNYGEIPLFFSAKINNIKEEKPFFDSRFSVSLKENDVDKYINKSLTYPIKIRGEVLLKGILKGRADNYNIFSTLILNPETDISYLGANFGDDNLKREVKLSLNLVKNIANLNNFEYIKYIISQNNRQSAVSSLRAFGKIILKDKIAHFENLKIKTNLPTTTRVFNILFKKSILKQGQFTSDIVLNGPQDAPKILGKLALFDVDIPLHNLKIKDANLNFKNDTIDGNFKGVGFDSDVEITAQMLNKQGLPIVFKNIDIASENINVGKIVDEFSSFNKSHSSTNFINTKEEITISPKDILVEAGTFKAKNVNLYNIKASNLISEFCKKDSILNFYNSSFDIADGEINSQGEFNFDTTQMTINADVVECLANDLTTSFLGVKDQIFGKMNGSIYFTGSNLNTPEGIKTIKSRANFIVKNGKMPKLGSLEYLIRAGNIYKSGILGLTLNNIIEVLIPYKTGEFEDIRGELFVENGKVENLEVFTSGDNLSLYIKGKYDILNTSADIKILGRLAKKVSNMLGPIGNTSFNSLINFISGNRKEKTENSELVKNINKIPLIELSKDDYRIFEVKVLGDLNKDDYIKTFNWLN